MEAAKIKNVTAAGVPTRVVAVGVGSNVDVDELKNISSQPQYRNVIMVQSFSCLLDVEEQLRSIIWNGRCLSSIIPSVVALA